MTAKIQIDLKDYGGDGTIEMGEPTLRRITMTQNEIAKHSSVKDGVPDLAGTELASIAMISVLGYVVKAPFEPTLNAFLDYADKLDAADNGSAKQLYQKMAAIKDEIATGQHSPFAGSPAQVTANSV